MAWGVGTRDSRGLRARRYTFVPIQWEQWRSHAGGGSRWPFRAKPLYGFLRQSAELAPISPVAVGLAGPRRLEGR